MQLLKCILKEPSYFIDCGNICIQWSEGRRRGKGKYYFYLRQFEIERDIIIFMWKHSLSLSLCWILKCCLIVFCFILRCCSILFQLGFLSPLQNAGLMLLKLQIVFILTVKYKQGLNALSCERILSIKFKWLRLW